MIMKEIEKIAVRFKEDNKIRFGMDMHFWESVPHDVDFYPTQCFGDWVTFVGDGYGILPNNKLGLEGRYGNGSISVPYENLPDKIKQIVYEQFKENIEACRLKKECENLQKRFEELVKTDFNAAKSIVDRLSSLPPSNTQEQGEEIDVYEIEKDLREYFTKNKEGKGGGYAIRVLQQLSSLKSKPNTTEAVSGEVLRETKALNDAYAEKILRQSKMIEQLKEGEWVKSTERLPEHNAGVLVFIPEEDFHITSGMWDISNKWVLLDEYRVPDTEVTHWMNIPAIPKEFQKEHDDNNKIMRFLKENLPTPPQPKDNNNKQ